MKLRTCGVGLCALAWGTYLAGCVAQGREERIEALTLLSRKTPEKTEVPRSVRFEPRPIAPGQWVQYLIQAPGGVLASYKLKVLRVGEVPQSFWLEEEWVSAEEFAIARQLVMMDESRLVVAEREGARFAPAVTDYGTFRDIIFWDSNKDSVETMYNPTRALHLLGAKLAWVAGAGFGKVRKSEVKAGVFKGCHEGTSALRMENVYGTMAFCADPQVPLSGIVEGRDPLGRSWELVDFGTTGAKSVLP